MKTMVKTTIESNIQKLKFGIWNEELEEFIPLDALNEQEASELLKAEGALVQTLVMFAEDLRMNLHQDLSDIWSRLDKMESRK